MKYLTLCENHLFSKAFKGGSKAFSSTVSVFVLKDKHAWILQKMNPEKKKLNRVGIAISGKFGSAVERNRAKRLVREAYRQIIEEKTLTEGRIIVIAPTVRIKNVKMQTVKRDLLYALKRLELFVSTE